MLSGLIRIVLPVSTTGMGRDRMNRLAVHAPPAEEEDLHPWVCLPVLQRKGR
jgi:hypothetical protein